MTSVEVGERLPEMTVPITPTMVVSTALATRDFQDVHHDRDRAQAAGSRDIFVNILTSTALCERYVTEWATRWAGEDVELRGIAIRLGAPAYPYDMLTFTGEVASVEDGIATVAVTGWVSTGSTSGGGVSTGSTSGGGVSTGSTSGSSTSGGAHVTGTVRIAW